MTEQQPIDVRDMAIVHRTFDRVFNESIQHVRAAKSPTPERVTMVADFVDFGVLMLHDHHESEDELLYPTLIVRAPDQAASTEKVEHEHQQVKDSLDDVTKANTAWRAAPTAENGEALAKAIERVVSVLQAHVKDEEDEVVPLAAVTLSQKEWDAIGTRAVASIPKKWKPVAFGILLEPLSASDQALMKSKLPPPVRLLYPILIDRPWKKYAATLRSRP